MKTHIKILLILLSFNSFVSSQNSIKTDTIKWSNYQMIIELPTKSHSHYETYEEGFFRTISCFSDSTVITIHCGAMVNLPLVNQAKYTITSKFVLDNDVRVLRGYCDSLNNGIKRKRYFREENYFKSGITVMYENVDESKLIYYDYILNNIKIINTRKRP
jgi:hypothetical protein